MIVSPCTAKEIDVVLHISYSWVKIRLQTKNQLPRLPGTGLIVITSVVWWWCHVCFFTNYNTTPTKVVLSCFGLLVGFWQYGTWSHRTQYNTIATHTCIARDKYWKHLFCLTQHNKEDKHSALKFETTLKTPFWSSEVNALGHYKHNTVATQLLMLFYSLFLCFLKKVK